jgi:hypothetical protein
LNRKRKNVQITKKELAQKLGIDETLLRPKANGSMVRRLGLKPHYAVVNGHRTQVFTEQEARRLQAERERLASSPRQVSTSSTYQQNVVRRLEARGRFVIQTDRPGTPDLIVFVKNRGRWRFEEFVEVKGKLDGLRADQYALLQKFLGLGIPARVDFEEKEKGRL